MLLESIVIKKDNLTTVNESYTSGEALSVLEDSGYRCIPTLGESGEIFRENIYKVHIYRHKADGGSMSLPVTYLLKNATRLIYVGTPFFKVFLTIKELLYIVILDENNHFRGTLIYSTLLNTLTQSWGARQGNYVLTIVSVGQQGDLAAISEVIVKHSGIVSCIMLDVDSEELVRRIFITLPADTTAETYTAIVEHLERKNFKVVELENLEDE